MLTRYRDGASLALLFAIIAGCASTSEDVADPVSPGCLECLTSENSRACGVRYAPCEATSSCDEFVMCQLMGRCFERPSGSGCEQEIECRQPAAASAVDAGDAGVLLSPLRLAERFEECARTTCAATCGFVE
jgi:hypothetical protein